MKKVLLYILLGFFPSTLFAQQQEECGTTRSAEDEAAIGNFISEYRSGQLAIQRDYGDSMVPVKFHIVATSTGTGGIDSADVFNELDSINSHYKAAGIVFYHCDNIDYINSNEYVNFEKIVSETLCDSLDLANVINIYFVPLLYKINSSGSTVNLCGYAYTSGSKNRVLMKNSCSTNGSTLAHELGHYFSLPHTHSTGAGDELADGSNCGFAGDLFCDTPADPTLSNSVVSSVACLYTGTETDANGDLYTPETKNVMSYSRKSCRNQFSAEQLAQMQAYLVSYRNYLHCPSTVVIPNRIDASTGNPLQFSISPNPSFGQFIIRYQLPQLIEVITITVVDELGRVISKKEIVPQTTSGNYFLNDLQLAQGVYFIKLESGSETQIEKVLIVN
ncbi:MAG: zinc-dependent metalloprotease [Flavobacteriales bacterium]|nr:zinc-dependent metalloprotease [Flavobacteriales bacterium]